MDVCPCCTVYYRQTTCQPVTTEVDFEKEHPSQALALPFLMLLIAGIINAIGVTLFIAPVQLYDSGISGTSILLSQLTPDYLSLSFFLILLNIPLLLFGFKRQGRRSRFTPSSRSASTRWRPGSSPMCCPSTSALPRRWRARICFCVRCSAALSRAWQRPGHPLRRRDGRH